MKDEKTKEEKPFHGPFHSDVIVDDPKKIKDVKSEEEKKTDIKNTSFDCNGENGY